MEYYSAIKRNTFESVLMRWMNLAPIIQTEVSQKEKYKYCTLTPIYGIYTSTEVSPHACPLSRPQCPLWPRVVEPRTPCCGRDLWCLPAGRFGRAHLCLESACVHLKTLLSGTRCARRAVQLQMSQSRPAAHWAPVHPLGGPHPVPRPRSPSGAQPHLPHLSPWHPGVLSSQ